MSPHRFFTRPRSKPLGSRLFAGAGGTRRVLGSQPGPVKCRGLRAQSGQPRE